jgi:hypothetical protein
MPRRPMTKPMRSVRDELSAAFDAPSAPAAMKPQTKPGVPSPDDMYGPGYGAARAAQQAMTPTQGLARSMQQQPPDALMHQAAAIYGQMPPQTRNAMQTQGSMMGGLPMQQAAQQAMAQRPPGPGAPPPQGMAPPPPPPSALPPGGPPMGGMRQGPMAGMPPQGAQSPLGMNGGAPPPNPQAMQGQAQAQAMQGAMGGMSAPPAQQPGEMEQLVQQAKQGAMPPPAPAPQMDPMQRQAMANSLRQPLR